MINFSKIPIIAKVSSIGLVLSGSAYLGWASIIAPFIIDYNQRNIEEKRIESQRDFEKTLHNEKLKQDKEVAEKEARLRILEKEKTNALRAKEIKERQEFEAKQNRMLLNQQKLLIEQMILDRKARQDTNKMNNNRPAILPAKPEKKNLNERSTIKKFKQNKSTNNKTETAVTSYPESQKIISRPLKTLRNVSEGDYFDLCGYSQFTVSSVSGSIILKSSDRNIPDRKYRGYEKKLQKNIPLVLWDKCILAVNVTETLGTIRFTVSSTKIN